MSKLLNAVSELHNAHYGEFIENFEANHSAHYVAWYMHQLTLS